MRTTLALCSALLVVAVVNCFPQEVPEGGSSMPAQPQKRQLLYGINPYGYSMGYMNYPFGGLIYRKRRDAPEEPIAAAEPERIKRQYPWNGAYFGGIGGYYNPYMRLY